MPATPTSSLSGEPVPSAEEMVTFDAALKSRRQIVNEYLEKWPGATDFKPSDIHDALYSYVRHRGKGLRPSLLMLCCSAVGGDEAQAVPAAAAVEIFHIWTLVHDDIIDRDAIRRGNPTVHARYASRAHDTYALQGEEAAHYGLAVAILTGDLQQSWAYALLSELASKGVSDRVILRLIKRMAESLTPQLLEGEMLDVQFAVSPPQNLSQDDVLHMLTKKTAALLEYAAWAGATIGLGDREDVNHLAEKLGRFASLCGTAFQLQDDILGLTADEQLLGKPVGSDIREGKRTLVVYRALARLDTISQKALLSTLGNDHATPEELGHALSLIEQSGAQNEVRELANSFISQAIAILDEVPESESRALLRSWAQFMLARQY
jgi:geranylgeranyl diphosphate synthase, type I